MKFSELVQQRYVDAGFTKSQAVAKIHLESGVSMNSIWAALGGTRVQADTARDLAVWAQRMHRVTIDQLGMTFAPTKGKV